MNRKCLVLWVLFSVVAGCREAAKWQPPNERGPGGVGAQPSGSDEGGAAGSGGRDNRGGETVHSLGGQAAGGDGCESDAMCDDGVACNGFESCHDGACVSGEELECTLGTECTERDGAAHCEYAQPSPWLVFVSEEYPEDALPDTVTIPSMTLRAIPSALLGKEEPIALEAAPEDYPFFETMSWSPSGRFLVYDQWFTDFGDIWHSRLSWTEFGKGLPEAPRPIANLPQKGDYFFRGWDHETDTLLVESDGEAYVVRFEEGEAVPTLAVQDESGDMDVGLCRGASWVLYMPYEGGSSLVPAAGSDSTSDWFDLGGAASLAPDQRTLAIVRSEVASQTSGLFVQACDPDGAVTLLDTVDPTYPQFEWSPTGTSMALETDADVLRIFDLTDPEEPELIFERGGLEADWWSTDGKRLLVSDTALLRYGIVDIDLGTHRELPIAWETDTIAGWCGEYLVVQRETAEGQRQVSVLSSVVEDTAPLPLFDASNDGPLPVLCDRSGEMLAGVATIDEESTINVFDLARPVHGGSVLYRAETEIDLLDYDAGRALLAEVSTDAIYDETVYIPVPGENAAHVLPRSVGATIQP